MEHFLINASVCLFSLWLVYKLLLENTSWHQFKRFYLVGALIISGIIPFLVVNAMIVPMPSTNSIVDAPAFRPTTAESFDALESMESIPAPVAVEIDWTSILWFIYLLGTLIMAVRLIKNLYALRVTSTDELETYKGYHLVLRDSASVPHSFYNRIYASLIGYKAGKVPELVLDHEKAHLDQKHSLDILFIEFLMVLMWFNPLLYLIKYSIKLNHEFLADQAVINNGVTTAGYQETLLSFTSSKQYNAFANTFNFPIIKKRFTIMKTRTTTISGLLRSLAIVPVLALLVISCSQKTIQPQSESTREKSTQTVPETYQKNVILNSPRITTDAMNKSKDSASSSSFYIEVANEPDSEDFKMRKAILIASLNQNKKLNYKVNGKKSTVTSIQEYLVNHETADVAFVEGSENFLQFSENNDAPMNLEELQKVYTKVFKYRPKEEPTTFVAINETKWKVVTVDATVSKGSFERKGAQYTYDSSDINQINVFDKQGKLLNEKEYKNLAVGFHLVWWKGEQKYKELLKQPEIIEGFKNGTYAVFYRVGNKSNFTKDYEEALKLNASNTFLWMGSTLESTTINIDPHSWANTNPSYKQFQKYVTD
jgi:beta-lactamase regulating signal transducer with metallopeptidase domain